jgi:hypothetical protein
MTRQEFFCKCFDVIEHWANGKRKHLREVTDKLYTEVTKPHWISVFDEKPPQNEAYLAYWQYLGVTKYRFVKAGAKVSRTFSEHVTHWMPLPEPPKENV